MQRFRRKRRISGTESKCHRSDMGAGSSLTINTERKNNNTQFLQSQGVREKKEETQDPIELMLMMQEEQGLRLKRSVLGEK